MTIRDAREDDAEQIKELVAGLSHFHLSENETKLPEWLSSTLELSGSGLTFHIKSKRPNI